MPGLDPLMQRNQRRMKALLNELTTREGLHPTVIDGVNLARADSDSPRRPVLYQPSICVLVSGHTKGYIGSHCITYDENNLPIPLPIECETVAGKNQPTFGGRVRSETSLTTEPGRKKEV